jgi:transcriptional regulator with XRE-family HTH domain
MKRKKKIKTMKQKGYLAGIVSANLQRIRRDEELTQTQLATRAAVSQSNVAHIEHGASASLERIEDLARAMGRDPLEMFWGGVQGKP